MTRVRRSLGVLSFQSRPSLLHTRVRTHSTTGRRVGFTSDDIGIPWLDPWYDTEHGKEPVCDMA